MFRSAAYPTRPFAHPDARVIHPVEPPRSTLAGLTPAQRAEARGAHRRAWLRLRQEGIGTSDASTLAHLNAHETMLSLFSDKTGRAPLERDSDVMRIGRDLEASTLDLFAETTGLALRRVGMLARKDIGWHMATPDSLTSDGGGVEIKTTTEKQADQWDAQPSDHAMVQAQWAMWVTGAGHWYIAVRFRDSGRFIWYRVERDGQMIATLTERAATFWFTYVQTDTAPPLEGREADLRAARELEEGTDAHPAGAVEGGQAAAAVGRALGRIGARERELKKLKKAYTAEFARLIGRGETLLAYGVPVGTYRRNGPMATSRYLEECPEAAERFMEPMPVLNTERALAEDPDAVMYVSRRLSLKSSKADRDALVPPPVGGEEAWLMAELGAA